MAYSDSLDLLTQLETSLRNGVLEPVYFLYGKEKFLIDRSQRLIIDAALEPHERDFNLSIVYGGDAVAQAVLADCASYPTMAQRRVVVVRDFDELSGNERFEAYVKNPNPQTVLVIVSGTGVKSNPYAAISRASKTFHFGEVQQKKVPGWIASTLKKHGFKVGGQAADMLSGLAGSDLETLSNEIEKLIAYVGDRKEISENDVLEVAGHSSEFNVFELQKKVVAGDFVAAEAILERMLQVSSNTAGTAIMTVTVLASYYTKLLKLSGCHGENLDSGQIAKKTGIHPYYLKESQAALRKQGPEGVSRANLALLGADFELKGGSERNEWLILTMLVRRLTEGKVRNIARAAA